MFLSGVCAAHDPFADFDSYAQEALQDWNTPGLAIAIVKDGRVVLTRGYGVRALGRRDAVTADTIFPIASVTKAFNATALATLVDEEKLRWTDPVIKFLPDFQLHDAWMTRELTLADLLSHRTGLDDPDLLCYCGAMSRADLLRRAKHLPQVESFRTGSRYNNLGPIIAGEILERVSGKSWSEFVRERVFKPLEMRASFPDVRELRGVSNVATSYVSVDGKLQEDQSWTLPLSEGWERYRETIRPSGAICSTVNDLANFVMMQLDDGAFHGRQIVKPDTIRDMQALHSAAAIKEPTTTRLPLAKFLFGAGLGWQIRDYRGRKLVMHSGSSGTVIGLVPEENLGVVVLTNLGCGIQYMIMHDTIDRLLGISRTWTNQDWTKATIDDYQADAERENARLEQERGPVADSKFPLSAYAGNYESDLYGRLQIIAADSGLSLQFGPNCRTKLSRWSAEKFRAKFVLRFAEDWLLTFTPQHGRVAKLTIAQVYPPKEIATFSRVPGNE